MCGNTMYSARMGRDSSAHLEERQDVLAGGLLLLFQRPAVIASQNCALKEGSYST